MNLYGDIPKETLVETLESYEYSPDFPWELFTGNNREICHELWGKNWSKEIPEIWELTMEALIEHAPKTKEKRLELKAGLERVYKLFSAGEMDIERYAGCVGAQCAGKNKRWRAKSDIEESVKEKFKEYIEDTDAFLNEKVHPFILKKIALKLLKDAEEGIEKVKANS